MRRQAIDHSLAVSFRVDQSDIAQHLEMVREQRPLDLEFRVDFTYPFGPAHQLPDNRQPRFIRQCLEQVRACSSALSEVAGSWLGID